MMPMLNQKCCPLVAGGWILKPLGISTNGYSGVTANQSEDFNTLIKQLTMRKERDIVDSLALAVYFLTVLLQE